MTYLDLTCTQLREMMRERQIPGRSRITKKDEMIEALEANDAFTESDRLPEAPSSPVTSERVGGERVQKDYSKCAIVQIDSFAGSPPAPLAHPTESEPEEVFQAQKRIQEIEAKIQDLEASDRNICFLREKKELEQREIIGEIDEKKLELNELEEQGDTDDEVEEKEEEIEELQNLHDEIESEIDAVWEESAILQNQIKNLETELCSITDFVDDRLAVTVTATVTATPAPLAPPTPEPEPEEDAKVSESRTGIEWTDRTWNPLTGCTKVSPGCAHCYAEAVTQRFHTNFPDGFKLTLHPERLSAPLKWRKPSRVFVNSMSDLFHKDVPLEFIQQVFDTIGQTPQHTYQILTKRHERLLELAPQLTWHQNIWMGVSVENQDYVERVDRLRKVPAKVRFLSCEPLLGPLDLDLTDIHWVIVGGESGNKHRPIKAEWVENIRDRCQETGVAFFFKQWGGRTSKANGRLLNGRVWDEMPSDCEAGMVPPAPIEPAIEPDTPALLSPAPSPAPPQSTQKDECYTPDEWLRRIRRALRRRITIDPCTTPDNRTDAEIFFTKQNSGLDQPWNPQGILNACAFINPPYSKSGGKSFIEMFLRKFWEEFQAGSVAEAIVLVLLDCLGSKGSGAILDKAQAVAYPGRINFVNGEGKPIGSGNRNGLVFAYFGPNASQFQKVFGEVCFGCSRVSAPAPAETHTKLIPNQPKLPLSPKTYTQLRPNYDPNRRGDLAPAPGIQLNLFDGAIAFDEGRLVYTPISTPVDFDRTADSFRLQQSQVQALAEQDSEKIFGPLVVPPTDSQAWAKYPEWMRGNNGYYFVREIPGAFEVFRWWRAKAGWKLDFNRVWESACSCGKPECSHRRAIEDSFK